MPAETDSDLFYPGSSLEGREDKITGNEYTGSTLVRKIKLENLQLFVSPGRNCIAQLFSLAAMMFGGQAAFFRAQGRPGLMVRPGFPGGNTNQGKQTVQGILAVGGLGTETTSLDDQFAGSVDPAPGH